MNERALRQIFGASLVELTTKDRYLLENDLSERCVAARLAMYLQEALPEYSVDVEYNRDGGSPKRLSIPDECANRWNKFGEGLVVPDLIIHHRCREGPNVLVAELKKTTNPCSLDCDRARLRVFMEQFGYRFGVLVECETRQQQEPAIRVLEWNGG